MQEYIDSVKASGKTVTWGTSGATTMHSGIGHYFFDAYGIPHKKVPFKGGSKARAALVSQSVEAVFGGVNTVLVLKMTSGHLHLLAQKTQPLRNFLF